MLSKFRTCSAVNTASVETLTTRKRRKRSVSKSWYYFLLEVASFDERQLFYAQDWILSWYIAKFRFFLRKIDILQFFDRNTFISVIFSSMCACSKIFEQLRIEIYLWKNRIISSIFDQISIVFWFWRERELKIKIFNDWNSRREFFKEFLWSSRIIRIE